jgi:hypothetical protein
MGRYFDVLRNLKTPHPHNQKNLINPSQEGYLGLLGSPPPIEKSVVVKSRWWLVHFPAGLKTGDQEVKNMRLNKVTI